MEGRDQEQRTLKHTSTSDTLAPGRLESPQELSKARDGPGDPERPETPPDRELDGRYQRAAEVMLYLFVDAWVTPLNELIRPRNHPLDSRLYHNHSVPVNACQNPLIFAFL